MKIEFSKKHFILGLILNPLIWIGIFLIITSIYFLYFFDEIFPSTPSIQGAVAAIDLLKPFVHISLYSGVVVGFYGLIKGIRHALSMAAASSVNER